MNSVKTDDDKAGVNQYSLDAIENIKEKERIGFGGWLGFVQAGMILILTLCYTGLYFAIVDSLYLNILMFSLPLILIIFAMIQFYRYQISFRWLLIFSTMLLAINAYFIVGVHKTSHYVTVSIFLAIYIVMIVLLFISQRVKNTFSARGQQIELERRKRLVGLDGWLFSFQLILVLSASNLIITLFQYIGLSVHTSSTIVLPVYDIAIILILLIAIAICLVLFYKRKMSFKYAFIAVAVLNIISGLLHNSSHIIQVLTGIMIYGLLILALFKSHRVKNTFQ